MRALKKPFTKLIRDEAGATAIEYSLVAGLIVLGLVSVISNIGAFAQADFESVQKAWDK